MPNDNPQDRDCFHPPDVPIEVECIHCGNVYNSSLIEWRYGAGPPGYAGAWCCPIPGCDGVGFLFDIWPTDPEWRDEQGNKVCFFDDEDEEFEEFDASEQQPSEGPQKRPPGRNDFLDEDDIPF